MARRILGAYMGDAAVASLFSVKMLFYLTILAFAITIVGLMGKDSDGIWVHSVPSRFEYCAYKSSLEVNHHGIASICKYIVAVAAIGLIISFFQFWYSFLGIFFHWQQKLWYIEDAINLFMWAWWLTGAIVATAARPSTGMLNLKDNRTEVNAVQALLWANMCLYFFNIFFTFFIYWVGETGGWIPTVEDYRVLTSIQKDQVSTKGAELHQEQETA
eukprot:jgi/Galph1/3515/GphlegSOOS_G2133.1